VNRSTNVLGVADLSGILRPNEIHLSFSKPFLDELKGASYQFLHNEEVLVGRHPALRPSDIQKVSTMHTEGPFVMFIKTRSEQRSTLIFLILLMWLSFRLRAVSHWLANFKAVIMMAIW